MEAQINPYQTFALLGPYIRNIDATDFFQHQHKENYAQIDPILHGYKLSARFINFPSISIIRTYFDEYIIVLYFYVFIILNIYIFIYNIF